MEKRKFKRFKTRQIAKIDGKLAVVNDVSHKGIQVSTSLSPKNRKIDISFEVPNGEKITVVGLIQWIKWKKRLQSPNQMGISIKNATPEYLQFVESCNILQ
jgi:hypothetical protein